MKRLQTVVIMMALLWSCGMVSGAGLKMDWTYHDDSDDVDDRDTEQVPGREHGFIGEGATVFDDSSDITLYVLTEHEFAGELEEQVFARWWNGEDEHWVMGQWETNVRVGDMEDSVGKFQGLPRVGSKMLDLWKIEIERDLTKPGDNFYVIQLKGWEEGGSEEAYLLRDSAGDAGQKNELGQEWIGAPEYFGHDWSVTILE